MTALDTRARTPWHLWAVVVIGVLWNGFGAYDYVMSHTAGEPYFRSMGMTDAQIAYYNAMPAWMTGVWAIGVWGSVAGTILLALRSRWAFQVFVASLTGPVVSLIYTYGMTNGAEMGGQTGMIMNAVILAACLFFVWYSRLMAKRGVLR